MLMLKLLLETTAYLLFLPVLILFVEILPAVIKSARRAPQMGERPRVAVVMPAHNEAAVIANALRSIAPQLSQCDRLLVVADNCVDDTAAIAGAQGAEVVVRADLAHRGKGYALD